MKDYNKHKRQIVIGDIHGCFRTLHKLLFDKLKITKDDELFFVGDFIDRGPRSKDVIDLLLYLQKEEISIHPIRGNHEEMLIQHYLGANPQNWFYNGAAATLRSFGISHILEMEKKYIDFFVGLPYYTELDDFIIVHAGMNFELTNPFIDTETMVWTRDDYVDLKKTNGRGLICGHTPHTLEQIKFSLKLDKIQLDAGCVYLGRREGLGWLCAMELNSMKLYYEQNCE